ncbi:MAG: DNA repair protein RecN [Caldilineales bacterium]|nr:DNA repair protein RecN [Caldilineales bacterium]MDW8317552.1 DNA repair protein RecN [Anaerolineae bacterium]
MLAELRIANFAIIDTLTLRFCPGFNVLTGETGAGKSIIIDAVDMLLGGKAGQEVIRSGAEATLVEGTFHLSPASQAALAPVLEAEGLEGDDPATLVLARELRRGGRTVARVNGRAVALAVLKEIGNRLVDIHGQSDHLSLMRPREHIHLLDRYASLLPQREQVAGLVRRLAAVRKELASLRRDQRELARRLDLLSFQAEEIEAAHLTPGEDKELESERRRLANAEQLLRLTEAARVRLAEGDGEQPAASDLVSEASGYLARLAGVDPDAAPLLEAAEALADQLSELIYALESYAGEIEFNPERLNEVEERLSLIHTLKRKYGDTIEEVIAFGRRAREELALLENAEVRTAELEEEEARLLREIGRVAAALSTARREAARRMAEAVERELADLRMARARFAVDFRWEPAADGAVVTAKDAPPDQPPGRYAFDATGLDAVEFLVSANPGEPLKPLVKVASGGETSRLMLALKTVLGRADETPTLIFDEIDVGIGGRVGATVGRKLWELTAMSAGEPQAAGHGSAWNGRHQVLCITHLPQLAAYGDAHFAVRKQVVGDRTVTEVVRLEGPLRVQELAAMLGSTSDAGRESVEEMLKEVAAVKRSLNPAEMEVP